MGPERGADRAGARAAASPPSSTSSWRSRRRATPLRAGSGQPPGDLRRRPQPAARPREASARATTTRCSSCSASSSATRSRRRTSCGSASPSRCRRSSSPPAPTSTRSTRCSATSRSARRSRVRQFPRRADRGDAVAGDGQLPRHGQQPQAQCGHRRRAQRELRARADAALLDRHGRARRRTARRSLDAQGKPIADLRPGGDRGLRARLHRLDLSDGAGRDEPARYNGQYYDGRMEERSRATTTTARRRCSTARRAARTWR